jgi:sigma-E factor negative regulatory protein RseB
MLLMQRRRGPGQAWRRAAACAGLVSSLGLPLAGAQTPGSGLGQPPLNGNVGPAAASAADPAPTDARAWLARSQGAAQNRNYQGTVVFTAGGAMASSRVAHYCDGSQRYERTEPLDGQARQVLRHNDVVKTLWPQSRLAVVEPKEPVSGFPALPGGDAPVAASYEMRPIGLDRIAGHEAQVVLFKPRDGLRYAQRLWAERGTGLLLRADTLGAQGEVIESTAFTDLQLGARSQPDAVLQPMKRAEAWHVLRPSIDRTQLDAEGWTIARPVAGFTLVGCVKRALDGATGQAAQVLQSVFSDGLTHVSVFVEPFDPKRHKAMRTVLGATQTVTQQVGNWWFTVVGDVPRATVDQFLAALERKR